MSELRVQRKSDVVVSVEYGCQFRRILPWKSDGPSATGLGTCLIGPGQSTTPHAHIDVEHFYVIRGHARAYVGDMRTDLGLGDVLIVDSQVTHHFENLSGTEDLELLAVWAPGEFGSC